MFDIILNSSILTCMVLNWQVSMRFNQAVLYPGEPAQISIQSEPGSMCMLNVVDQSVQLVRHRGGTANHVTEDRVGCLFAYNAFCYSYSYCNNNISKA